MDILLVRHGEAVTHTAELGDSGRWLTAKGRRRTRRAAAWLTKAKGKAKGDPIREIWTSPLVRSVQSAEILASALGLEEEVQVCSALSPERSPREILEVLARRSDQGTLALVGHEPLLSQLAAVLLGLSECHKLSKSGVVRLSWKGTGATAKLRYWLDGKTLEARNELEAALPSQREPLEEKT